MEDEYEHGRGSRREKFRNEREDTGATHIASEWGFEAGVESRRQDSNDSSRWRDRELRGGPRSRERNVDRRGSRERQRGPDDFRDRERRPQREDYRRGGWRDSRFRDDEMRELGRRKRDLRDSFEDDRGFRKRRRGGPWQDDEGGRFRGREGRFFGRDEERDNRPKRPRDWYAQSMHTLHLYTSSAPLPG